MDQFSRLILDSFLKSLEISSILALCAGIV
jgi:hypothetical protein